MNPNEAHYKYYGAKGIKQEYNARQFIHWYLSQDCFGKLTRPSVDRIDHSKNYSLDNIRLIEMSDNIRERNDRAGNPASLHRKSVDVYDAKSMDFIKTVESISAASKMFGVRASSIGEICNKHGHRKSGKGYTFRFSGVA